jgi:hypothetical protein
MQVGVMGRVSARYQSIEDHAAPPLQSTSTLQALGSVAQKIARILHCCFLYIPASPGQQKKYY